MCLEMLQLDKPTSFTLNAWFENSEMDQGIVIFTNFSDSLIGKTDQAMIANFGGYIS